MGNGWDEFVERGRRVHEWMASAGVGNEVFQVSEMMTGVLNGVALPATSYAVGWIAEDLQRVGLCDRTGLSVEVF
jgi:hypothetical protein